MEIGERIRRLRERRDWTQKRLADKVGIDHAVFNRIELGKRKARSDELAKIASALDVSIDYLSGKTDASDIKNYNDKETTIDLISEQAAKWGYKIDDPEFLKMLFDAFNIIGVARGKNEQ